MTTTGHLVPSDDEYEELLGEDTLHKITKAYEWVIRGDDGQPIRLNVDLVTSPPPSPETDLSVIKEILKRLTESQDDLDIWLDESVDGEESTAIMVDQDNVPVSLVLHFDPKTGKLEALHLKENPFAE